MNNILLIEDDLQICEVIETYFRARGCRIHAIHNGGEALSLVSGGELPYELVLLDIMLPEIDGFTICRSIRKCSNIPIIFITARAREEDVLFGYDLGGDDYIIKPFLLSALYAKCEALVRRSKGDAGSSILTCGAIRLDTRRLRCFAGETEIELPPKEFAILRHLMEHPDWVVSRDMLLDRVWGADYFGSDRVVDNHIKKLRKALGSAGNQIRTVIGRGYKLTK